MNINNRFGQWIDDDDDVDNDDIDDDYDDDDCEL